MDRLRHALFRAEVEDQVHEIQQTYQLVEERMERIQRDVSRRESLAYQLHNLYCSFEDLFEIVARTFENSIDDLSRYHVALLKRMKLAIPGVRPALLPEETFTLLDQLRSFRHFFRHAYRREIDLAKLQTVLESATTLKLIYERDISLFLDSIEAEEHHD